MKESWDGSETERFIGDTIYERDKYHTVEAKPYKIKKAYFTFLAEDEEGNEKEFKEEEITTETKETTLMHLKHFGFDIEERPNHIVLNPGTDAETVADPLHFTNHFLFNERSETDMNYPLTVATRIKDELDMLREYLDEEKVMEAEEAM